VIFLLTDAVARNVYFPPPPMREEFFREIGEVMRFGKQRHRNVINRKSVTIENVGSRKNASCSRRAP